MLSNTDIQRFTLQSYKSDELFIRPIAASDIKQLYKWRTNPAINKHLHSAPPQSYADQIEWFAENQNQPENMYYMIYQAKSPSQAIGYCQLVKIDWKDRTAETGLVIDSDLENPGIISIKSGVAMLRIAFDFLHTSCVYSSVNYNNQPSRHFFESMINSELVEENNAYRKDNEILYKTDKDLFNNKLSKLLNMKNPRWRNALNIKISDSSQHF